MHAKTFIYTRKYVILSVYIHIIPMIILYMRSKHYLFLCLFMHAPEEQLIDDVVEMRMTLGMQGGAAGQKAAKPYFVSVIR